MIGLVAVFAACAVANWWAVAGSHRSPIAAGRGDRPDRALIAVTKTAATLTLVAIAAVAGDMAGDARAALIVAVVLCLAGDVALLGDSGSRFMAGLGSFAAGHLAYVVCALLVGVSWPRLVIAVPFLAVLFGFRFVSRTVPGARRHGGPPLMGAVVFYAAVISAMVITATGTRFWSAAVGAMLFAVSDWMIGYDRFVTPFPGSRVAIMVTYHIGQVLLILGLIAAG